MNNPVQKGQRIVVRGNLQPYALALVADVTFIEHEARWAIILEWPNASGGPAYSRVYDHDEGKGWYRYSQAS